MNLFPEHITINGQNIRVNEFIKWNHRAEYEKELAEFLKEWYNPKDYIEATTSGSTGLPKIIRLKKKFVMQSALRTIKFFNLRPGDRILHCLPVKFIAGKLMVVRALIGSLNLFTADPGTDFFFLQTKKFHFAAMIPHQVQKILDAEPRPGAWLQQLDQLLIGGSSIPYTLESRLQNIHTPSYSSYAMTETATHIALRRINGVDADEYYHCLNGITVNTSEDGCLQIFMHDLWEQPLNTSDLAEVKNEKSFQILGRADNVIISGGIKFFPEQLEKKLEPYISHPFLITSLPHDSLGQQLILVLEGQEKNEEVDRLQEICKTYLDKYEQPRRIIFIRKIPKTNTGKPVRENLNIPGENKNDY